ncbi:DUF262 domain-containing protein [Sulfitobacter sp. M368]|uniref:DUF262 domain-containing protein n=1 Tax=Sulfitobacter sp. M368 TaxID=2867021 RepID=UPI0021A5695D|nr:DUF262 domain-containing protein [Sulfitobacter sp. M368]UWR15955.1 DUF262 domain-containing protein [Sulfitobacter sp. M368]
MADIQQELVVRGETVERVYSSYRNERYIVNRRYQRKLIWTLEEKQSFIDSLAKGLPVPIILLAEPKDAKAGTYELIDGMQRLNAVTSFINNEYAIEGGYFDLNTFAEAKALLDSGELEQKEPVLDRSLCVAIAGYPVPLSIYESAEASSVDEVFRRINSGGRQLSRQELRVAGATDAFAQCVRVISSHVRGDASSTDIVSLNDMKNISITNRELEYGINADDVFWIKNNIITRDQLRQSRDEELIADLVAYMASDSPTASRTELFDDYYGSFFPRTGAREERFIAMDKAVKQRTTDLLSYDFSRVFDDIVLTIAHANSNFTQLLFADNNANNPAPRYFQAIFLAFHELMVRRNMIVSDRAGLVKQMVDCGKSIAIQEGGRWGAENRSNAVNAVVGMIQGFFEDNTAPDPAKVHWVSQFQNLLTSSRTEQSAYDFKQGFLKLADKPSFDEDAFRRILETCVAISNIAPKHRGYVVVGVAENEQTATRVSELFGTSSDAFNGFYVTGVEHEAKHLNKSLDDLFHDITQRLSASPISEPLKSVLNGRLKSVSYYDKTIFVFEVEGQKGPSLYDNRFFQRQGTQTQEVATEDLHSLFARFS